MAIKKLSICFTLLVTAYTSASFAAYSTVDSKYNVSIPSFTGSFIFGVYGLYWRPSVSQLDDAILYPSSIAIEDTETTDLVGGRYHSVDPHYNWAYKLDARYVFAFTGNDVALAYTRYNDSSMSEVKNSSNLIIPSVGSAFSAALGRSEIPVFIPLPPTITLTGFSITATPITVTIPISAFFAPFIVGELDADDIDFVRANSSYQNRVWDLDFGQYINVGANLCLRLFGGIRYANLKHRLDVQYDAHSTQLAFAFVPSIQLPQTDSAISVLIPFNVASALIDVVNQKSHFNGVGPRLGFDASYYLGGGVGVVGSLSTSLLVGEIDNSLQERIIVNATATFIPPAAIMTTDSDSPEITSTSEVSVTTLLAPEVVTDSSFKYPDQTRIVPNFDAKLGLNFTYQFHSAPNTQLSVEGGYMISHYFHSVDILSGIGGAAPELFSRHTINTNFFGPYIGVQVSV